MQEGLILGRPPVDPVGAGSRNVFLSLTRGASLYSMGAGGFGTVPAMPRMQRFATPANPHDPTNVSLSGLYAQSPGLFRGRLQRMFIDARRAQTGR